MSLISACWLAATTPLRRGKGQVADVGAPMPAVCGWMVNSRPRRFTENRWMTAPGRFTESRCIWREHWRCTVSDVPAGRVRPQWRMDSVSPLHSPPGASHQWTLTTVFSRGSSIDMARGSRWICTTRPPQRQAGIPPPPSLEALEAYMASLWLGGT